MKLDWLVPGTVLWYRGKGFVSRGIELWTGSPYSHVSIVTRICQPDLWQDRPCRTWALRYEAHMQRLGHRGSWLPWINGLYVVESTSLSENPCKIEGKLVQGVQVHSIQELQGEVWASVPSRYLTLEEEYRLTEACLDRVGIPYDFEGAGLAGSRLLKWFCPCTYSRKRFFCSELVASVLLYALEGRVLPEMEPGAYAPGKLLDVLTSSGLYQKPRRLEVPC